MRKKNPILVYSLIWLTVGLYFYYWIFAHMKVLNELNGTKVFNVKNRVILLISIYIIGIVTFSKFSFIDLDETMSLSFMSIVTLSFFFYLILTFYQISKQVLILQKKCEINYIISRTIGTFSFFLCLLSIPYIQYHTNEIISKVYGE